MNQYKTVNGDLLDLADQGLFDAIVHGCNCQHLMGGGIAKSIRERYPQAFKADLQTKKGDYRKLGTFSTSKQINTDGSDFIIVNGYTQFDISSGTCPYDPLIPVDYNSIATVFRRLVRANKMKMRIGFPLIGAGLAGGNWDIINELINLELDSKDNIHEWTLVKFENQWSSIHE